MLPLQAFESLLQLYEARATHEDFCIPMCMLPATISNNVPGTDLSIGADTALNAIVEVRQSINLRQHCFVPPCCSLKDENYTQWLLLNETLSSQKQKHIAPQSLT